MSSKTVDENYKRLRVELDEHLSKDKRLTAIADKISKGAADFSDTARYTQIVSKHMSDVIKRNIGELKQPMAKEMVCKELLRDHYELINGVFGEVQVSVDEKLGVHLKPVKPAYPAERVDKWAHSLEDPTVEPSVIVRRAASGSENIGNSIHDDCIKENAKVREQAGLDCYLTRDAGGGCCSWCAALEGRYNYAGAPDDIFRRHDNCTCTVTYECGRKRQDVWSKKTWEADPKDIEARKAASEAARPTVKTPAEAQAINEQSKSNITVLSKEQAEAINEQNKPVKFTEAEAKEREAKALGKDDNVNNLSLENQDESDKMKVADSGDVYHNVSVDAVNKIPKLDVFATDELNVAHQKASQDLLAEVSKHKELPAGTEFSIVYDENMNRIPNFDYVQGEVGRVRIDEPNVPYHAFHNHGSNETFSVIDIVKSTQSDNMLSLTVTGNLGNEFVIVKESGFDKFGFNDYLSQKTKEPILSTDNFVFSYDTMSDETKKQQFKIAFNSLSEEKKEELKKAMVLKCEEILEGGAKYGLNYKKARLADSAKDTGT